MLNAVVELSDQFVNQVPGGGAVAVTVFSPATVVLARAGSQFAAAANAQIQPVAHGGSCPGTKSADVR
jgi:hypothetical protein